MIPYIFRRIRNSKRLLVETWLSSVSNDSLPVELLNLPINYVFLYC